MTLNTYLFFDGACAEAFEHYRRVFGGEFTARMTYADGPEGEVQAGPDEQGRIMHVSLPVGGSVLMGSDTTKGMDVAPTGAFAISYSAGSREDADAKFAALQEGGGSAAMPMADAFWGAYFGMLKDRFGVRWMVSHDQPAGRRAAVTGVLR